MADFLTINRVLLSKIEASAGVEETPTPADNAIKLEQPRLVFEPESEETNESSGFIDQSDPVLGSGPARLTGTWNLKGSGSAGAAPEVSPLVRASSFSETLRASDLTGTAQTGAAGTITLASGAGAGVNRGEIIETTGGTGGSPSQRRVILSLAGDVATVTPNWTVTPDNTTTYAIRASALYAPVSADSETATNWLYLKSNRSGVDSVRRRMKGSAGTWDLSLTSGRVGKLNLNLIGQILGPPSDQTPPTGMVFDTAPKLAFKNADAYLNGAAVKFRDFTLAYGGGAAQPHDPGEEWGLDIASVIARNLTGTLNPYQRLISAFDVYTLADARTKVPFWINYGPGAGAGNAGKNVSIVVPEMLFDMPTDEDLDGFVAEGLTFKASGDDTGVYVCFW